MGVFRNRPTLFVIYGSVFGVAVLLWLRSPFSTFIYSIVLLILSKNWEFVAYFWISIHMNWRNVICWRHWGMFWIMIDNDGVLNFLRSYRCFKFYDIHLISMLFSQWNELFHKNHNFCSRHFLSLILIWTQNHEIFLCIIYYVSE